MPVTVKGSGGGGVTLDAGAAASNTTLTLPNVNGTILQSGTAVTVAQGGTGATSLTANNVLLGNGTSAIQVVAPGTSGNVLTSNGTTWASTAPVSGITQATAVATTSGTSVTFTGIPSTVKRITVMFKGVSTSGTSNYLIQIGSGSVTTSGYLSASSAIIGSVASQASTVGFVGNNNGYGASAVIHGSVVLDNLSSNNWVASGVLNWSNVTGTMTWAGSVSLSGALDRVVITTANGTDTFSAGSVNILYE